MHFFSPLADLNKQLLTKCEKLTQHQTQTHQICPKTSRVLHYFFVLVYIYRLFNYRLNKRLYIVLRLSKCKGG